MSEQNKNGFIENVKNYFQGVRQEWSKITWPEVAQVKAETIFVIVIVFIFTMIILFFDFIYGSIFGLLK